MSKLNYEKNCRYYGTKNGNTVTPPKPGKKYSHPKSGPRKTTGKQRTFIKKLNKELGKKYSVPKQREKASELIQKLIALRDERTVLS